MWLWLCYSLIEWFFSVFDKKALGNSDNLINKIDTIKEEIDFTDNLSELTDYINDILNNDIFKTNNLDYSNQIKILIDNYKLNYKNDFDTLLNFENEIINNSDKTLKKNENFEDLKLNNKFVKHISKTLNDSQKKSLLNCSNLFIKRDFSRGFLYMDSDNNLFVALPQLKILDFHLFLHELNHVISYSSKKDDVNVFTYTGIFKEKRSLTSNNVEEYYSFLNEVIADYFVYNMDIKSLENKKLLFKSKSNSTYSLSFVLLEPFMDKYFDVVKECFITSDVDKLEKLFGAHNLEALDHLLKDFSGYAQTMQSVEYLTTDFEEGLYEAMSMEDAHVPSYVTKYYNCFLKMQFLMKNIERYQKNNDLDLTY